MDINEDSLVKKFMAIFVFASLIFNIASYYISTAFSISASQIVSYSGQLQTQASQIGNLTTYIKYLSPSGTFGVFEIIFNYISGFLNGIGYIVQFAYHIILILVIGIEVMVYLMFSFMPHVLSELGIGFLGYIFSLINLMAILILGFVVLRYIRNLVSGAAGAAAARGH